jgi:dihydrolipoamide dehydrogenase
VTDVKRTPEGITLTVETPDGSASLDCRRVLVAAGVQGNTDGIGLEDVGVEVERSFIRVDDTMRTSVPNIYAIGDVTGKMLLAHVAMAQGVLAVEGIAGIRSPALDYKKMPRATYCNPQVTSFGYTEKEAGEMERSVKIGKFPFQANGKALALGEAEGMVKLVVDADTDEIIGAHMIGPEVTEALPEIAITGMLEGSVNELGLLVHSHPTLSEAVKEAALAANGEAIHI